MIKEFNTPNDISSDLPAPTKTFEPPGTDPWLDWKPQWALQGLKKKRAAQAIPTPYDLQERHSPTQTVETRLTATRSVEKCQRRIVDARLWDAMTPHEQAAAFEISRAFELITTGLGFSKSDPSRIPGARNVVNQTEKQSFLINRYVEWSQDCVKMKLNPAAFLDVIAFGLTCKEVDHSRRKRNGFARENLFGALKLYCTLRGWPASK